MSAQCPATTFPVPETWPGQAKLCRDALTYQLEATVCMDDPANELVNAGRSVCQRSREREIQRQRQTDRQTDTEEERDRDRE